MSITTNPKMMGSARASEGRKPEARAVTERIPEISFRSGPGAGQSRSYSHISYWLIRQDYAQELGRCCRNCSEIAKRLALTWRRVAWRETRTSNSVHKAAMASTPTAPAVPTAIIIVSF